MNSFSFSRLKYQIWVDCKIDRFQYPRWKNFDKCTYQKQNLKNRFLLSLQIRWSELLSFHLCEGKNSKCLVLKYQAWLGVLGFKTKPLASGGKDGPRGQISSYFSCNKWVISILILIISIEEVSMMIMSNHHSIQIRQ